MFAHNAERKSGENKSIKALNQDVVVDNQPLSVVENNEGFGHIGNENVFNLTGVQTFSEVKRNLFRTETLPDIRRRM